MRRGTRPARPGLARPRPAGLAPPRRRLSNEQWVFLAGRGGPWGPDRRDGGDGRARGGAGGAPGAIRGGDVSESVAKALRGGIGGEKKRGISTFLFRRFGPIRAFATDLDKRRRRGPLHGRRSRRSPRRSGRPAPPRAPRRAFCTRACTSNCTSRERNAHLDVRRTDPPAPPRTAPTRTTTPHRPRPTDPRLPARRLYTTPGLVRTGSWSRVVSHADPSGPVGGADPGPARDRSCPAAKERRP